MNYCDVCGFQTNDNLKKCPRCGRAFGGGTVFAGDRIDSEKSTTDSKVVSLVKPESFSKSDTRRGDVVSLVKPPKTISGTQPSEVGGTSAASNAQGASKTMYADSISGGYAPVNADAANKTVYAEASVGAPVSVDIPIDADYGDGYKTAQSASPAAPVRENLTPKKNRRALFTTLQILGIVVCIVGAFLVYRSIDLPKPDDDDSSSESSSAQSSEEEVSEPDNQPEAAADASLVRVPSLTGFVKDTAETVVKQSGLDCNVVEEANGEYAEGVVFKQSPESDRSVPPGTEITIYVAKSGTVSSSSAAASSATPSQSASSAAVQQVNVPNVVGLSREDAEKKLKDGSLNVQTTYEYSDSAANGKVISQSPASGKAAKNTTVGIVVSKGPDTSNYITVGNYVGMDINDVIALLEPYGINVNYTYEDNDIYVKNSVLRQQVSSGTMLKPGSTIDLVVAKGLPSQQTAMKIPESNTTSAAAVNYQKPVFSSVRASSQHSSEGSYTYDPMNALLDNASCWCEGASDDGVGEYIELSDTKTQTVSGCQIKNGYTRDSSVFNNNGRMTKVRFEFSDGTSYSSDIDPNDMSLQSILFPSPVETSSLRIVIESVKSGDKYKDTCITLVMPF